MNHLALIAVTVAMHACPAQPVSVSNRANVRPAALSALEAALTDQAAQLRAVWGTPCVAFVRSGGWLLVLERHNDGCAPAWGCHYGGGLMYAATLGLPVYDWARVASHELMETLVDPAARPHVRPEVCDPVNGQTYLVDGVPLERFEPPSYFK